MSTQTSLVGKEINLTIEKMVIGGAAMGRTNGLVVFVDDAAPGDELLVTITEHKKNLAYGSIKEILRASDQRIKPPCPHAGQCGGCSWQHLSAQAQIEQKQQLVESALRPLFSQQKIDLNKIIPSPEAFNYRNRIQMTFDGQKFNFFAKRSHNLIPVQECIIAEKPINQFLRSPMKKSLKSKTRYEIRLTDSENPVIECLEAGEEASEIGFSQVNRFQNKQLIDESLKLLASSNDSLLFELYAGAGNFTFPIFKNHNFKEILAVEGSQKLVQLAHKKIQTNNISPKKLNFFQSDVESFLKNRWPGKNDVIFMDPPRIGATEFIMKTLAHSKPRQIVYLSCHPVTLNRDLLWLLKYEPRYKLNSIQPFEMFPQTDHVETLVSLTLTES
jgi:23S rRNA (uracil1939-C5)-methyltransferase